MKLEVKKIGRIKSAELDLGKITIVAGQNDSGKSTISKLMFSFISGLSEEGRIKSHNIYLRKQLDILTFGLYKKTENEKFRKFFLKNNFFNKSEEEQFNDLQHIIDELLFSLNDDEHPEELEELKEFKMNDLYSKTRFDNSVFRFLYAEFNGDIRNLLTYGGYIKLFNKKSKDIYWSYSDSILDEEFHRVKMTPFRNAIYLESPFLTGTKKQLDHISVLKEDINNKLAEEKDSKVQDIINEINDIIDGSFLHEDNEIFLIRNDLKIPEGNIATGIRSLGMLKLLLEKGILKQDSYLILDEPEVHLHPEWQVKLAMIISMISKNLNVSILINTHSPYFVEAMDLSKDYYKIDDVRYYLTELEKEGSIFQDVTKNISDIYISLSESSYKILDKIKEKLYFEENKDVE